MMSESIISLTSVAFGAVRSYLSGEVGDMSKISTAPEGINAPWTVGVEPNFRQEEMVSAKVLWGGWTLSCFGCVIMAYALFGNEGISWWACVIALLLACVFSILG
jgi:hypothetical protein